MSRVDCFVDCFRITWRTFGAPASVISVPVELLPTVRGVERHHGHFRVIRRQPVHVCNAETGS
jgi:hypothetical protein